MSPLRFLGLVLAALLAILLLALLAFNFYGREESWKALFGPADLGPYNFSEPTRTGKLNDTLACPPSACTKGLPDLETPHFRLPAKTLFAIVEKVVKTLPGKTKLIGANPVGTRLRAIVYSPAIRIPSTLSVMVRPTSDGGADLYAYSRSQIGYYDMGRNTDNITRLMDRIAGEIEAEQVAARAAASKS